VNTGTFVEDHVGKFLVLSIWGKMFSSLFLVVDLGKSNLCKLPLQKKLLHFFSCCAAKHGRRFLALCKIAEGKK
jgi:hypothetical protein